MTEIALKPCPAELGEVLSFHEELHMIYRSFDSLYEIVEYNLVSKDASLVAPIVCIIRDRLGKAGLYYEDTFAVPHAEKMFKDSKF